MKVVNVQFEDKEHKLLEDVKKIHGGNWHDFILDLARLYKLGKEKE